MPPFIPPSGQTSSPGKPGSHAPTGRQTPSAHSPEPTYPPEPPQPAPRMIAEAQLHATRAKQIDRAVKQCTATPATKDFGLVTPSGKVLKFNQAGDTKAAQTLKNAALKPGKKLKAEVTGTMPPDSTTVNVASFAVKGKQKPVSATASPSSRQ
ncbi:MAG: hypothetical protein ACRD2B_14320 [Terriglobia bacterium]